MKAWNRMSALTYYLRIRSKNYFTFVNAVRCCNVFRTLIKSCRCENIESRASDENNTELKGI